MLCPHCQNEVSPEAQACPKCGHPISRESSPKSSRESSPKSSGESSPKSRIAAALLCFFFGYFGIHNFYVGKIGSGLLQFGLLVFVFLGLGMSMGSMLSSILTGYMDSNYLAALAASSVLSLWVFIDLILILCGAFRDKSKLRVDRW